MQLKTNIEPVYSSVDLDSLFADLFYQAWHTVLVGGANEPLYRPVQRASNGVIEKDACLIYRDDFFSSALHEVSHWCIAGRNRLLQADFGYWYVPEGRSVSDQLKFQQVEIKPQALECLFSIAAGYPFQVSQDNFSADSDFQVEQERYFDLVCLQVKTYIHDGLPVRAQVFMEALASFYGNAISKKDCIEALDFMKSGEKGGYYVDR